jgi:hypothetical protein
MCFERHWVGSSASNTDALNVDIRKHERYSLRTYAVLASLGTLAADHAEPS